MSEELGKDFQEIQQDVEIYLAIAQEFEDQFSRIELIRFCMSKVPVTLMTPGYVHRLLFGLFTFKTYITTNYDNLLEMTCRETEDHPRIVASQTQLQLYENDTDTVKVVKMHGDFENPDFLVITKNDYDNFFVKNEFVADYVKQLFRSKTILMMGYSGLDPDYQQIFAYRNRLGDFSRKIYVVNLDYATNQDTASNKGGNLVEIRLGCSQRSPENSMTYFLRCLYNACKRYKDGTTVYGDQVTVDRLYLSSDAHRKSPAEARDVELLKNTIASSLPLSLESFLFHSNGAILYPKYSDTKFFSVQEMIGEYESGYWRFRHVLPIYAVGNGDYWGLDLHDFYTHDECHVVYVCHYPLEVWTTDMNFADWVRKGIISHWWDYMKQENGDSAS